MKTPSISRTEGAAVPPRFRLKPALFAITGSPERTYLAVQSSGSQATFGGFRCGGFSAPDPPSLPTPVRLLLLFIAFSEFMVILT